MSDKDYGLDPGYNDEACGSRKQERSGNREGCFIATAIYNDYNAPQVLVLREFRDQVLRSNWIGRQFVYAYYQYSPSIAKWLKTKPRTSNILRKILDVVVFSRRLLMVKMVEKIDETKASSDPKEIALHVDFERYVFGEALQKILDTPISAENNEAASLKAIVTDAFTRVYDAEGLAACPVGKCVMPCVYPNCPSIGDYCRPECDPAVVHATQE